MLATRIKGIPTAVHDPAKIQFANGFIHRGSEARGRVGEEIQRWHAKCRSDMKAMSETCLGSGGMMPSLVVVVKEKKVLTTTTDPIPPENMLATVESGKIQAAFSWRSRESLVTKIGMRKLRGNSERDVCGESVWNKG